MKLKLLVFYGSVRSTRQGIKAARFVANKCRDREHEVFLVDPFAFRLPLLDKICKEYPPGGAPELLERLADRVKVLLRLSPAPDAHSHHLTHPSPKQSPLNKEPT